MREFTEDGVLELLDSALRYLCMSQPHSDEVWEWQRRLRQFILTELAEHRLNL